MKNIHLLFVILILPVFTNSQNSWITDTEMQFKISAPRDYKQNQFRDGTDKILALVSPDENVAVRVRAMKVTEQVTIELVQQVFEQNIISGATRIMNESGDLHGIPATASAYTWKFNNIATVIGAYYIIQNGFAYIVWTIVPQNLLQQRSAEADKIIDSFQLLNSNQINISYSAGLGSLSPGKNNSNEVVISNLMLGNAIDNNFQVTNPTTYFEKNAYQINIGFAYSGSASASPFQLKWYSKTHNTLINETTLNAPQINNGRGYGFISNQGNAWPTGQYTVELWHNGKNLGIQNFQIQ